LKANIQLKIGGYGMKFIRTKDNFLLTKNIIHCLI